MTTTSAKPSPEPANSAGSQSRGTAMQIKPATYIDLGEARDLLSLQASKSADFPYFLHSAAQHEATGRFDILFGYPQAKLILDANFQLASGVAELRNQLQQGFLAALDAWWLFEAAGLADEASNEIAGGTPSPDSPLAYEQSDNISTLSSEQQAAVAELPFHGGWFLYLGYELAAEIEPRLRLPKAAADSPVPTAMAVKMSLAIINDHQHNRCWAVVERGLQAQLGISQLEAMFAEAECVDSATPIATEIDQSALQVPASEPYTRMVDRAKQYIIDGDIFQANLAHAWQAARPEGLSDAACYAALTKANPGPFAALLSEPEWAVISSSPERLVRTQAGQIDTRPIAGTRARGHSAERDAELLNNLLSHPKERAEHLMLIDLERNDLGRVCVPGSIKVEPMMATESYAHVHHIVSNIAGELRGGVTPGEVIRAVFPGGTITGCPKVRCMEIIAELEDKPRGAYTGALGYLDRYGNMDLNILIRSWLRAGEQLQLHAGAGIVADSEPAMEYRETFAKARGPLAAFGLNATVESTADE